MSLLFGKQSRQTAQDVIPSRRPGPAFQSVTDENARRHSAVWACVRLRADLISTLPIKTYRTVGNVEVEVPTPAIISEPGGPSCRSMEWRYSSQSELDMCGNAFGIIAERDSLGLPKRIDLVSHQCVTVHIRSGQLDSYRIDGKVYAPRDVWHERQYTVAGSVMGMSPIAHAAYTIGAYLSAQEFALDWFANGSIPSARLKNTAQTVSTAQADVIKDRFKNAVASRDVFVHGSDWDYEMISVTANESQFLDTMRYGVEDVCRFFGVPADEIDAASGGSANITYANITQKSLALLVKNLQPAIARREDAWSYGLLPAPRKVKLNTDALMRLDPTTRQQTLRDDLAARVRTFSEVRALMDLPPLTDSDLAEFAAVNPVKQSPPTGVTQ